MDDEKKLDAGELHDEPELDIGPYGPRGKDSPPLVQMFKGYAIIFAGVILLPFILFLIVRFLIL